MTTTPTTTPGSARPVDRGPAPIDPGTIPADVAAEYAPRPGDTDTDPLNPADSETYLVSLLLSLRLTDLRDEALTAVAPADFWNPHYATLWGAARALRDTDRGITTRALITEAGTVAARRALDRLTDMYPRVGDYTTHVHEVRKCGRTRTLLTALDRVRQRALTAEDIPQAIGWAYDELAALGVDTDGDPDVFEADDLVDELEADLDDTTPRRVIPTPWPEVNELLNGGLQPGRFYVIGARPGVGKSVAAHNIAVEAATLDFSTLMFSMEMPRLEVMGRVMASGARVELSSIARRDITDHERMQIGEFGRGLRGKRFAVVDKSDVNMAYVKTVARNRKRRVGLDVLELDYLQLVTGDSAKPREQQVAAISRACKLLSRELDIAVVVPAQLNREGTRRSDGRPQVSDLRESGAIEADADVVMLLASGTFPSKDDDGKDHPSAGEPNGMIDCYFEKNRQGRKGHVSLNWRGHYATIG